MILGENWDTDLSSIHGFIFFQRIILFVLKLQIMEATLNLPENIYRNFTELAEKKHRRQTPWKDNPNGWKLLRRLPNSARPRADSVWNRTYSAESGGRNWRWRKSPVVVRRLQQFQTRQNSRDWSANKRSRLFNPRRQIWSEHFEFSENKSEISGKTACGRVTVSALKMNNKRAVKMRKLWVSVGRFQPTD